MTTDSVTHDAAIQQALDNLKLNYADGDTGLQVESAIDEGWVQLTSMRDGLKRPPIPKIHVARVLAKRLPDKSPAFWIEGMPYNPPEPQVGSIKCYFHPDFDETDGAAGFDRKFIDDAGLRGFTCNNGDLSKNNRGDFKSEMQRDAHMRSRHRRQLEVVEKALGDQKEREERAEAAMEREYQRQQTAAMLELLKTQIAANTGGVVPQADLSQLNKAGLKAHADRNGIKVDLRWSEERMRQEIEAATNGD